MTPKTRRLIIAAIVLGLLLVCLLVVQTVDREEDVKTPGSQEELIVLTDFKAGDLRYVRIVNESEELIFSSSDGKLWHLDGVPEYYRLDQERVLAAIQTLAHIQTKRLAVQDAGSGHPAQYGLAPPRATITLKDKEDREAVVELGNLSPTGRGVYTRRAKSSSIVVSPALMRGFLKVTSTDFRNLRLPTINFEVLKQFRFRDGGEEFAIEARIHEHPYIKLGSPFDIVSPWTVPHPLDSFKLQRALSEETPLPTFVTAYLDDANPSDPALGLTPAEEAGFLYIEDADGGVLHLIIGAENGQGHRYTLFGDRDDAVFLLPAESLALLARDPFDFADRFVFLGSIDQMNQVKVESQGKTWVMSRQDLGDPHDIEDDLFMINGLKLPQKKFSEVYQKFIGLLWEGRNTDETGIDVPDVRITVEHIDPEVEAMTIQFWPYDDVYYQGGVNTHPREFILGRYQVEDFITALSSLVEGR